MASKAFRLHLWHFAAEELFVSPRPLYHLGVGRMQKGEWAGRSPSNRPALAHCSRTWWHTFPERRYKTADRAVNFAYGSPKLID